MEVEEEEFKWCMVKLEVIANSNSSGRLQQFLIQVKVYFYFQQPGQTCGTV